LYKYNDNIIFLNFLEELIAQLPDRESVPLEPQNVPTQQENATEALNLILTTILWI